MNSGWKLIAEQVFREVGFDGSRISVLVGAVESVWDLLVVSDADVYDEALLLRFSTLIAAVASVEDLEKTDAYFQGGAHVVSPGDG